ncbi:MAG: hypothetical protein LBJ25_04720 [Candidatus Margulisbacteria bacterium]|nr:hypothetical protein [Candidatus Margulisiibacteriota bacterium]
MSNILGLGNNEGSKNWSNLNTDGAKTESKNPYYNKEADKQIILVGGENKLFEFKTNKPIDLSQNSVEQPWDNNKGRVNYSISGNTLTITTGKYFDNSSNRPEVVDRFVFSKNMQTNGYRKLVVTVLEKEGNFNGDYFLSLNAVSKDGSYVEPDGWDFAGNFIATKQSAHMRHTLSVGDALELDISANSEVYIDGQIIAGENARLKLAFEFAD